MSAAFYVVKIDNLTNLFNSIFDAARWPVQVFRGVMRWVFTFIVPLALMTTYPAEAMLGRLPLPALAWSVVGAGAFGWLSRRVWLLEHRPLHLGQQLAPRTVSAPQLTPLRPGSRRHADAPAAAGARVTRWVRKRES